jgi:putative ABC transport system permease protein
MKAQVMLQGWQLPAPGFLRVEYQDVSPAFFRTMGIPLRRGRAFEDPAAGASAAVINESFSRECWGAEDPVGKQITIPGGRPCTIAGVVGDVRQYGLRSAPPGRQIYRPLWPSDVTTLSKCSSQYLVVRTSGDPERIAPLLKQLVRSIDPARPVIQTRTMQDLAFMSTAWDRLKVAVVGLFSVTALLLTLIGVYAVVSHSVSRRRREIGIRIALGGRPGDIRRMVLRQGVTVIIAGLGLGILVALALTPLVSNQLFEVTAVDLPTPAGVSLLLVATGLMACYLPVRGATRIDAVAALRAEQVPPFLSAALQASRRANPACAQTPARRRRASTSPVRPARLRSVRPGGSGP